jgi:magnesium and cobalt exporter, CNNM family
MELGETRAGEIMTPRTDIFALAAETPWEDACGQVIEAGHTRVPVYDGDIDNIVGVLYAKDLLAHVIKKETHSLREVMRKPYFVPETKPLDDLLREFQARKVHLAVALDEYGGTSGVVTIEDVLEEIVGDITDEYDEVAPELLLRLDDQVVEADGRLHIDELNDEMHLGIPEDEDYDTVAGLVYTELGYIPITGETLSAHGARFTVLDADDRKIIRLRVEREQQTAEEVI